MKTTKARAASAQDAVLASITSGGTPGTLRIYTGSAPADLSIAATGTLLAGATMGPGGATAAFGSTSTTTLIAAGNSLPWTGSIVASGTAGYWRVYDGASNAVLQGTVGTSGSGAELILSSLTFTAGGTFTVGTMQSTISGIT